MVMEQLLTHSVVHNKSSEDGIEEQKAYSVPPDINSSGGFDCNICLDTVQDPVVTVCGHLYCWPCIYKWIHHQSISPEIPVEQQPQCPVCKAEISERTLVPLYGRGQSATGPDQKAANVGLVIPNRPKGPPCGALLTTSTTTTTTNQYRAQQDAHHHHGYPPYQGQYSNEYLSAPAISLAGNTAFHPVINMFGEMICTRFLGDSQSFHTCPNSYGMAAMQSARARRNVMQVDQSLSRLSFFLCCCLVLCLVLF